VERIRIACPATMAHDRVACHVFEQQRIDRIVWQYWINAAAPLYDVRLTPEDEAAVTRYLRTERQNNEKAAKHFHTLWLSVIRLQHGEDPNAVYSAAALDGVTKSELERELAYHRSEAWLKTGAERATVASMEEASRNAKVLAIRSDHLRDLIRKGAAAEHIGYGDAEEQLWTEVANRTHTRIVDPTHHLPSKRGVLNINEETIQLKKSQ
jgi:hypothetical protein